MERGQYRRSQRNKKGTQNTLPMSFDDVADGSRTTDFRCLGEVRFSRKRGYRHVGPSDVTPTAEMKEAAN